MLRVNGSASCHFGIRIWLRVRSGIGVIYLITQSRLMSTITQLANGKPKERRLSVGNVLWVALPALG